MGKVKDSYDCALVLNHDIIGGKWKLRILWHILEGDNRFSLLSKSIQDISHKVLTSQLKELEENHIIVKHIIENNPPKVIVYEMNPEYQKLIPLLREICSFAQDYAKKNHITLK